MRFAALALQLFVIAIPGGVEAQSLCVAGQETWLRGCAAECTASWSGGDCPRTCIATPPPGQIILNYRHVQTSENNGGFSVDRIAAGQEFNYSQEVQAAYSQAASAAGQYGQKKASARIAEEGRQAASEALRLYSSHQLVRLNVNASKHGSMFDRKRGWSKGYVDIYVRCIAPSNLDEQIKAKYGIKPPVKKQRARPV